MSSEACGPFFDPIMAARSQGILGSGYFYESHSCRPGNFHMPGFVYISCGGRSLSAGSVGGRPGPYARPPNPAAGVQRAPSGPGPMRINSSGGPWCGPTHSSLSGVGGTKLGDHPLLDEWQNTACLSIRMRGLPFSSSIEDVIAFLAPLKPLNSGRPSGEVDVDFSSHGEAKEAMKKNRGKIGSRYIELFFNSSVGNGVLGSKRGAPHLNASGFVGHSGPFVPSLMGNRPDHHLRGPRAF
ncbi:unnamed protein product, partial [Protopolystoma xenopodis]